MNLTELKQDFYKRYSSSDNFLSYSRAGLLCSLLGDISLRHCPSLSCSLSMHVQVYGRKINGEIIKLQTTKSNTCIVFHPGNNIPSQHRSLFEMIERLYRFGIHGAELIFDVSVPDFFNYGKELNTAIFNTLSKIYAISPPIEICSTYNTSPYYALNTLKKGYCTSTPDNRLIPLPLTGFKIAVIQDIQPNKSNREKQLEKGFNILKRIYPHIKSFADISPDQLEYSKNAIRDKTLLNYLRHIVDENERIQAAAADLKKCSIKSLVNQMNLSEQSIEKLWNPKKQHIFLAKKSLTIDGVLCARIWKNGITAIVSEDNLDYFTDVISYDFENFSGYRPHICIADTFGD
ncbi:MAG: hypothetical protein ACI4C7_04015 [Clostridia bacterium]